MTALIDVDAVIGNLPHFETFCSVAKIEALVAQLKSDARFTVVQAGVSGEGRPIHHVRFGAGSVKALFVAFPHCKEPICGMTVFSLLTLLKQGHPALVGADVEWHIVPCIDPDGAILNEAWSQQPVTMERYMKGFYVQALRDQVDTSFPLKHKNLSWSAPSQEAKVLQGVLEAVRPDFLYSLHNAWTGGAFYFLSHDLGQKTNDTLHDLLRRQNFPLQTRPIWRDVCRPFAQGISELWSIKKHYDYLEKTMPSPERYLQFGAGSWDYLTEIKPEAVTLVTEMGYVRHPADESDADTGENLRKFKLRVDADSKWLGSLLIEAWDAVKDEVDKASPLYRAVIGGGCLPTRETLLDGGRPMGMQPTSDILFNPQYDRAMKDGDRFQACMVDGGFWFLCHSYQVVRLLKASSQTPAIAGAVERLEKAFDEALGRIKSVVDFNAFEVFDYDTMARVQLGSGLVVLNAILEKSCATTSAPPVTPTATPTPISPPSGSHTSALRG